VKASTKSRTEKQHTMTTFFKELFEYSNQMNQSLIAKLIEQGDRASDKAIQLQNHIINAHQIWNSRVLSVPPFGVLDIHSLEELQTLDNENYGQTLKIIDSIDLAQSFEYSNTKGQTFTNSLRDILFHVVNHSTHHRAQIATELKANGIAPLVTDYIVYKRGF